MKRLEPVTLGSSQLVILWAVLTIALLPVVPPFVVDMRAALSLAIARSVQGRYGFRLGLVRARGIERWGFTHVTPGTALAAAGVAPGDVPSPPEDDGIERFVSALAYLRIGGRRCFDVSGAGETARSVCLGPAPFVCHFPGERPSYTAPDGARSVAWEAAASRPSGRHALLLRLQANELPTMLHEFERVVDVYWAPASAAIAIAEQRPSGETTAWVYWGPRLRERINLEAGITAGGSSTVDYARDGQHVVVLEWNDPDTLRFAIFRPGGVPPRYFRYTVGASIEEEAADRLR